MISRRLFLASATALLIPSRQHRIGAATEVEEECVCLLCNTRFTAILDASGTTFGRRLDLKPLGAIRAPWRLPVCPKCRFVQFKDKEKFTKEELTDLQEYVNSTAYKAIAPRESSHFLVGKIYEHLQMPSIEIAHVYLKASWQVENDEKQHKIYLQKSLEHFDRVLSANPPKDESWKTAAFLRGELLRQVQKFEEAKTQFTALQKMDEFAKDPFPRLIAYELDLIGKKDSLPREIPK